MRRLALSLTVALSAIAGGAIAGDAEAGLKVFKKCKACHKVGADARNAVGPVLNNVVGRAAGAVEDYRYSNALRDRAATGLIWNEAELDAYLTNPKKYLPGTKMSFRGLRKEQDRANVIAYLATFSDDQTGKAVDDEFTVAPEVLAIVGDKEWGEYLSSECTTCHQADGANDGIPGIIGWPTDSFVTAMHAYREKHRDNPVMQLVTGRLSDDEIAALAAYFKGLE